MKIFLDMCCYNRPYDAQDQMKVFLETQAKLHIQECIRSGSLALVSSYTLDYEIANVPLEERKQTIRQFINEYASEYVGLENRAIVEAKTREIMSSGVKVEDAGHVASAILAGCDCFISTDIRLLKYRTNEIKMLNPVSFILNWEDKENA